MFQSPTIGYGILTVFPFDMEWVYDLGSAVHALVVPHSGTDACHTLVCVWQISALELHSAWHNKPSTQGL